MTPSLTKAETDVFGPDEIDAAEAVVETALDDGTLRKTDDGMFGIVVVPDSETGDDDTDDTGDTAAECRRLAECLACAGVGTERFIDVHDGRGRTVRFISTPPHDTDGTSEQSEAREEEVGLRPHARTSMRASTTRSPTELGLPIAVQTTTTTAGAPPRGGL